MKRKIKKITLYKTSDNKFFHTLDQAVTRELMLEDVEAAKRLILPKRFDTAEFENGAGYVQLCDEVKKEFLDRFSDHIRTYCMGAKASDRDILRYLEDNDLPAAELAHLRQRIDTSGRLWGQIYFAVNPEAGTQICLNGNKNDKRIKKNSKEKKK